MSYRFASLKQFLKLISAWAYEGHLRNALTGVATNKPPGLFLNTTLQNSTGKLGLLYCTNDVSKQTVIVNGSIFKCRMYYSMSQSMF